MSSSDGHVVARPGGHAGDARALTCTTWSTALHDAGLTLPVLVRFTDILRHRVDRLHGAFSRRHAEHGYQARYTAIYPIKVNQQQHVVGAIVATAALRVGLEAGSKPELMAVLGMPAPDGVIICNGYKDAEYIELALMGQRLGQRVTLVIEKLSELELVCQWRPRCSMRPRLGLRIRLAAATSGNWQNTGGDRSKFGLTAAGVLALLERLRAAGHDRLPDAAALPPRFADRQHERLPARARGNRALLRRAARPRRCRRHRRRRRRARRRLRGHGSKSDNSINYEHRRLRHGGGRRADPRLPRSADCRIPTSSPRPAAR